MEQLFGGLALALAFLIVLGIRLYFRFQRTKPEQKVIQGDEAEKRVMTPTEKKRKPGEHFLWGDEYLTAEEASLSFLAVGSPGSGKTLNILFLLRTVVERMNVEGSDVRCLIYDSKNNFYSKLRALGLRDDQIVMLNPFNKRRVAWDIAKDITDPKQADDLAKILIPSPKGEKDPYFTNTARALLSGVVTAFQYNKRGEWTLRDLLIAARAEDSLLDVLLSCKYTQSLSSHFKNPKTVESVRSTLDSSLNPLRTIAASWEGATEKITIADWFGSQKVFLMGNDPNGKEPIMKLNRLFFSFVAKEILARPESARAKHWIVLDELVELGKIDDLSYTMVTAREKGGTIVLGFQDLNGLFDEYGKTVAFQIMGCAQNVALLKASPTATEQQDWQSKVAGSCRYKEKDVGHNLSHDGKDSINIKETTKTDPYFIPSYFSRILKVSEEAGMSGVFFVRDVLYKLHFPGKFLWYDLNGKGVTRNSIPRENEDHKKLNFPQVSFKDQLLESWDESDLIRIGLERSEELEPEQPSKIKEPTVEKYVGGTL